MKKFVSLVSLISAFILCFSICICAEDSVFVSELEQSRFTSENAPFDGYAPGFDKNSSGDQLRTGGVTYEKGIWMHANNDDTTMTTLKIDLNGLNYTKFTATVGLHDGLGGTVAFLVYGDGEKLFESGVKNSTNGSEAISVDITDVKTLSLLISNGGDGYGADWAVWADAKLSEPKAPETDAPETDAPENHETDPKDNPETGANGFLLFSAMVLISVSSAAFVAIKKKKA